MPKIRRKPAYTLHSPTGQARCRIDGKDFCSFANQAEFRLFLWILVDNPRRFAEN